MTQIRGWITSKSGLLIIAFFLGWILAWSIQAHKFASIPAPVTVRKNSPEFKYINSILFTEVNKAQYPDLNPVESLMSSYINNVISNGQANDVSVYFRDLNGGHWTGVNEDDLYSPGSMLKVAVLLGYLRAAEHDSTALSDELQYVAKDDPGQYYKPPQPLKTGYYNVNDLINAMIIDSDNVATESLIAHDLKDYADVYKIFQLPEPPPDTSVTDFMSPHSYATLFRALYNATYLSSAVSDQALKLLTYTTFKSGLMAGLPSDMVVAHKFGEHRNTTAGQVVEVELHDCGIIYDPGKPYLLCVMTKGKDFPTLEGVIAGMSKLVYNYVDSKK